MSVQMPLKIRMKPRTGLYKNVYIKGAEEQCKDMKRTEKRMFRMKKREFHEKQIKEAGNLHTQEEIRRCYQPVNNIRKEFRPHIKARRDSHELILKESPAIMNRWK
jgi:hypothetical protein